MANRKFTCRYAWNPRDEEEKPPMATPNFDVNTFAKASDLAPDGEQTHASIFDAPKTGIAQKVDLFREVQDFVIKSVDNAMAMHAASYQRLLTFNEALVRDSTDSKFKEITRLMIFADLVVRTANLTNSADPLLQMANSLVKETIGVDYQPSAPLNILNDVYSRVQQLVADRIRISTDTATTKDDMHSLSA
jgi:hypothetical protein